MLRLLRATCALLMLVVVGSAGGCTVLGDSRHVTAELDDAAGLFVGNDVGVLGVPVGRITAIEPRGDVVEVEMQLTTDRALPASVGAVVVSRSVATDRYVELTPAFAGGPRLEDGDRIPLARTRTPVEFDEVLASLEGFSRGLSGRDGDARALRTLLAAGADALDGRGADAHDTIVSLAEGAGALAEHRDDLTGTVRDLDELTAVLAANQEVVRQFIESVTDATDLFADERERFGRALRSLSRALTTLGAFVEENRHALRSNLAGLTRVTAQLLEHQRELAEAVEVLPLTFGNIGRAVHDGRLRVKLPPRSLSPAPEITEPVCRLLPGVCDELGTNPDVPGLLEGLLGGGGR